MNNTDQTAALAALIEKVDALQRMLAIVADAPAVRQAVKQAERVAGLKAQVAAAKAFADASPSGKLELLGAMQLGKRTAFLNSLGVAAVAAIVRQLDDEERVTMASLISPQLRLAVACMVSEHEVIQVASSNPGVTIYLGGDSQSNDPAARPLTLLRGDPVYVMAGDWNRRIDLDERGDILAKLESGEISTSPAEPRIAAGIIGSEVGKHRLALDGAFGLELSELVLGTNGDTARALPVRVLEAGAREREIEAEEPMPDRGEGLKMERARQKWLREAADAKSVYLMKKAMSAALAEHATPVKEDLK